MLVTTGVRGLCSFWCRMTRQRKAPRIKSALQTSLVEITKCSCSPVETDLPRHVVFPPNANLSESFSQL